MLPTSLQLVKGKKTKQVKDHISVAYLTNPWTNKKHQPNNGNIIPQRVLTYI